jgi:hypothetical protein
MSERLRDTRHQPEEARQLGVTGRRSHCGRFLMRMADTLHKLCFTFARMKG